MQNKEEKIKSKDLLLNQDTNQMSVGKVKEMSKHHKIILNTGTGDFRLSIMAGEWLEHNADEQTRNNARKALGALTRLFNLADIGQAYTLLYGTLSERKRSDPLLINCIELLGDKASYKPDNKSKSFYDKAKLFIKPNTTIEGCNLKVIEFDSDVFKISVLPNGHEVLETPDNMEWETWDAWQKQQRYSDQICEVSEEVTKQINEKIINKAKEVLTYE